MNTKDFWQSYLTKMMEVLRQCKDWGILTKIYLGSPSAKALSARL